MNIRLFSGVLNTRLGIMLQRDSGRDLYNLTHVLAVLYGFDTARIAEMLGSYFALQDERISHAQAEETIGLKSNLVPADGVRLYDRRADVVVLT